MIESEIDLTTPDGAMNTFITMPDEGGPHRLVIFYMDAPGKREELHDMARRIATTGYAVLLPNLYYRDVREFVLGRHGDRTRMFELMNAISNDDVVSDTRVLLEHADSHPDIDASAVGCVGYCMSGPFAIYAAAELPERIRAAASIHGVRLATDRSDSPHRALPRVKAELYLAAAEFDEHIPKQQLDTFEATLVDASVNGRVEWYPGTNHGFVFRERESVYDKAAAERHWLRLHALFARNL